MASTGLEVFDSTLQKTNIWLDEVMEETDLQDRQTAYSLLRAVLHTLRDRVIADEAVDFGAQLPMLIRGFYFEGWHPAGTPLKYRTKDEFLGLVKQQAPMLDHMNAERTIEAIFRVLSKEMSGGELEQIKQQLPSDVRSLWH